MTKAKSTTKAKATPRSRTVTKAKPKSPARSASSPTKARASTKHERILAMLRSSAGATIAAIMSATGWQQHSVRGYFAGVIRKKHGLNLVSEEGDKGRIYRIKDGKTASLAA